MDSKIRQQLLAKYDLLETNERQKLLKKARDLRDRQISRKPKVRTRSVVLDEDDEFVAAPKPTASLDGFLLKVLEEEFAEKESESGTVVGLAKGRAAVLVGAREVTLPLVPSLAAAQQTSIAVGDTVVVADGVVRQVRERRTWLGRKDPDAGLQGTRLIVANVDVVIVVVSVVAPPLHPRLIDRYLLAIQRGGAIPIVVINKADLEGAALELPLVDPYREAGVEIHVCSAESGLGISELRARLAGITCAFVGHSGVGKSSLVNALMGQRERETGAVSGSNGRGQHTTVSSALITLPDRTRIIDTPGIRSLGLGRLDWEELEWHFADFQAFPCRMRGCQHLSEPDCGVRTAVEDGRLNRYRYETYLRLLEETK